MSLERINEDVKPTEPKPSQQPTQEPQLSLTPQEDVVISEKTGKTISQETIRPFSRENHQRLQELAEHRTESRYAVQETQEQLPMEYKPEIVLAPTLPQGIDNIKARVHQLLDRSGANTQNAKVDERVLLMASAVLEMCDLLKIYSESMNSEMERLNESASHNLNLQEMYAKTVENVTNLAVGNIYYNLKKQEKEAINDLMQYVEANSDQMEKDITACAGKVKSATEAAEKASIQISKSVKRFCTVKTIGDLLYYAAPVAVLIDVLLRLFDFI